jgi:hypothetical protein
MCWLVDGFASVCLLHVASVGCFGSENFVEVLAAPQVCTQVIEGFAASFPLSVSTLPLVCRGYACGWVGGWVGGCQVLLEALHVRCG